MLETVINVYFITCDTFFQEFFIIKKTFYNNISLLI